MLRIIIPQRLTCEAHLLPFCIFDPVPMMHPILQRDNFWLVIKRVSYMGAKQFLMNIWYPYQ